MTRVLEISRATTEESGFVVPICRQPPYFVDIPNMMFVATAFGFLAGRWVSLVGQFSIAIDGTVTASAQLLAYRGFARPGDSLDEIISPTHCPFPDTPKGFPESVGLIKEKFKPRH